MQYTDTPLDATPEQAEWDKERLSSFPYPFLYTRTSRPTGDLSAQMGPCRFKIIFGDTQYL